MLQSRRVRTCATLVALSFGSAHHVPDAAADGRAQPRADLGPVAGETPADKCGARG
jgi:hypothetical protein